jgi:hypothetical protein
MINPLNPNDSIQHKKKEKNSAILFDRFASKASQSVHTEGTIHTNNKDQVMPQTNNNNEDSKEDEEYDTEDESVSSSSVENDDDPYVAGLLDDPDMKLGRHRNVMIGDRGTGPIVSSTIQFVKPRLLKAELNQQFRDRFDGYEPPETQRKYIGARVIDGVYTLIDPTEDNNTSTLGTANLEDDSTVGTNITNPTNGTTIVHHHRKRQGSVSSYSTSNGGGGGGSTTDGHDMIRMPSSLTLSKIRSLKEQALRAAIHAKLEISTVALAVVYFERLCLDCRVDKSNRRLSFAACLLIAIKINEDLKALGNEQDISSSSVSSTKKIQKSTSMRFQSSRPTKKVDSLFASLFGFFTQDWNISLKHLFAAEWGVFAALQFRLSAKPSQVAFHFKLLMKSLGYDPLRYLGISMYGFWQEALVEEEYHRQECVERRARHRRRKDEKKLRQLERELEAVNRKEKSNRSAFHDGNNDKSQRNDHLVALKSKEDDHHKTDDRNSQQTGNHSNSKRRGSRHGLGELFKLPIGGSGRRAHSTERSWQTTLHDTTLSGKAIANVERRPVSPRGKNTQSLEIGSFSRSASMFARTSLEKDMIGTSDGPIIASNKELEDDDVKSTATDVGIVIY